MLDDPDVTDDPCVIALTASGLVGREPVEGPKPAAFGRHDVLAVALCYALYLAGMAWAGWVVRLGWPYYTALAVAVAIAAYHVRLIRGRERPACFRAFLHNHWLGFTIFAGVVVDYAVRLRSWPHTL
jgi:hypothetical protein